MSVPNLKATRASVTFGVVRQFGLVDLGTDGLGSGWSEPEDAHNWNNGCLSVFECEVEDNESEWLLEFTGAPFSCDNSVMQDTYLHVNGFLIGYWRLTEPKTYALKATIEPEQVFRRGQLNILKCVWTFPYAVRPSEKGVSDDSRELAFCFRSFAILKA